jgi:hypothetical protein
MYKSDHKTARQIGLTTQRCATAPAPGTSLTGM